MYLTLHDVYRADVEAQRRLAHLDRPGVPIAPELIDGALCLWRTNGDGTHTDTIRLPPTSGPIISRVLDGARTSVHRVHGGNISIRSVEHGICDEDRELLDRLTTAPPSTGYLMVRPLEGIEGDEPAPITPEVTVRITATPAEYLEARDLTDRIFRNRQESYMPTSDFYFAPALISQIAAFKDGRIVAAASILIIDGLANIWSVCTEPSLRRAGIASAVVRSACEQAGRFGAQFASLGTSDDLARDGGLYHRLGFRIVGVEYGWNIRDRESIVSTA